MKQEDKELLLKDLCARLPYGVKCCDFTYNDDDTINTTETLECIYPVTMEYKYKDIYVKNEIERIKPYLRPMSSMTEAEDKEMQMVLGGGEYADLINRTSGLELWLESVDTDPTIWFDSLVDVQDWLNAHHFDYRGLIEKGLAIEAPKEMYDKKEK